MERIKNIKKHIEMCTKSLDDENEEEIFKKILGIYESKISGGKSGFKAYAAATYGHGDRDYKADIIFLIEKLELYKSELLDEEQKGKDDLEKLRLQTEIARTNVNVNATGGNAYSTSTATATSTVTITLDQTISTINKLSLDILSDEEKEELEEKLSALEVAKNGGSKEKISAKLGNVLKYVADKGIEVGIASLPYLGEIAKLIQNL